MKPMKPTKMWLAQDDNGACYLYHYRPKYKDGEYYTLHFATGCIGLYLLASGVEKQIPTAECIVMTKEDYVKLKERKPSTGNIIAPTKMWIAQDDNGACFVHHETPKYKDGKYTTKHANAGLMGMHIINSDVDYIECIVMTEEYYVKLKEKKPRKNNET